MANRRKPEHMKLVAGTRQPCRESVEVVGRVEGEPAKPDWLDDGAAKLWDEHMDVYRARGQSLNGCGKALAQYCALEWGLIQSWSAGIPPDSSRINAYRIFAHEFHDTPASQLAGKSKPDNKFTKHGKR